MSILDFATFLWLIVTLYLPAECKKLNDHILRYEELTYNTDHVHNAHMRVKRSLGQEKVDIQFTALDRKFNLHLLPDASAFSSDFVMEFGGREEHNPDLSYLYSGKLAGEFDTKIYGSVINGVFSGVIHAPEDVYHVEKTYHYFNGEQPFHSIIYKESDVTDLHEPNVQVREKRSLGAGRCGNSDLKIKKWMDEQQNEKVLDEKEPPSTAHRHRTKRAITQCGNLQGNTQAQGETQKLRVCTLFLQSDSILWEKIKFEEKTTKSDEVTKQEIVSIFSTHVNGIKDIYEATNFTSADRSIMYTGISFVVRRVMINSSSDCPDGENTPSSVNPFCNKFIDASNFLTLNSLRNHDDFCLAYIFTFRVFNGGTLGLAWVGTPCSASGGICERYKPFDENGKRVEKSYNTGIVTFLNYGNKVSTKVSILTFAHEVGHNFGSPHDSGPECTPYSRPDNPDPLGNFIMFASATSGDKTNNRKFSYCSITNISLVLHAVITGVYGKKNCFKDSETAYCGNALTEKGEECDCGFQGDCDDSCCHGRNGNSPLNCKLKDGMDCSSKDPCCTSSCKIYSDSAPKICLVETECTQESLCMGNDSKCPHPSPKKDNEPCNEATQVCVKGECKGSICTRIGWDECFLTTAGESSASTDELCFVSCRDPVSGKCISTKNTDLKSNAEKLYNLTKDVKKGEPIQLPAGAPCDNFQGYCDVFHKCRGVDADGPLARLKNLIFNPKTLTEIKEWIEKNWWAVLVMAVGLVVGMAIFIKVCAVHTPSQNPKKRPAKQVGRRGQRSAQTQPQQERQPPPPPGPHYSRQQPQHHQHHHHHQPHPQDPPPPYAPVHPRGGPPPGKGKKRKNDRYKPGQGGDIEMRNVRV